MHLKWKLQAAAHGAHEAHEAHGGAESSLIVEFDPLDSICQARVFTDFHKHAADARVVLAHLVMHGQGGGHVSDDCIDIATDD